MFNIFFLVTLLLLASKRACDLIFGRLGIHLIKTEIGKALSQMWSRACYNLKEKTVCS